FGLDSDVARGVRLLFQPVLVLWALWSTDAVRAWRASRESRRRYPSVTERVGFSRTDSAALVADASSGEHHEARGAHGSGPVLRGELARRGGARRPGRAGGGRGSLRRRRPRDLEAATTQDGERLPEAAAELLGGGEAARRAPVGDRED